MSYSMFTNPNDCNTCNANTSYSTMNNGIQQPMPQVRSVPSTSMQQPMVSSPPPVQTQKDVLEKVVLEAVAKNNNVSYKKNDTNSMNTIQSKKGLNIVKNEVKKDVSLTSNVIAKGISSAFVLIVALAWNKAISDYLQRYIRFQEGSKWTLFYYAIAISLIYVLYIRIFHVYIQPESQDVELELIH